MQLDNIVLEKEKEKAVDAKNSIENDKMLVSLKFVLKLI